LVFAGEGASIFKADDLLALETYTVEWADLVPAALTVLALPKLISAVRSRSAPPTKSNS
jgi:hypothetical protein